MSLSSTLKKTLEHKRFINDKYNIPMLEAFLAAQKGTISGVEVMKTLGVFSKENRHAIRLRYLLACSFHAVNEQACLSNPVLEQIIEDMK